jgi:TRAP-type C4-dicarboxylate transport system substrate-binding protein
MKKRLFVPMSILAITVLMISVVSTSTAAAKTIKLRLAHGWSPKHHCHVILDKWTKDVSKATDGRVEITIFPGGALSTAVQLYDSTRMGVADLAWFLQGYTPGKFPLTSVVELPFMATSGAQASQALWELYQNSPEMQAEYKGVKVLSLWTVDTGQLMTARKIVKDVNGIKGMKLRVGSDTLKPTAEALGAVPILMPIGDLFDSLQKGVVDGTLLGTSAIRTFKLAPILKGMTIGHFFVNAQAVGINAKSWTKISAADQKNIMDLAGVRMAKEMGTKYDTEGKVGYNDAKGKGVEIYDMPAGEMAKWKQAVSGIHQGWVNDMNRKGLPGQKVYEMTIQLLKKYE